MLAKHVPSTKRVKISSTNVRLETTVHQKEETFQVIIDVIKNSTCFKAFTISANVPEIFIQQFWYTIKKVKDLEYYEFLLTNKKCKDDAEVFRKILDICPRIEEEEFIEVQDDDATLTLLTDLGYKGPLHKYTNMYMDHMHQPWRTLAAIINKCLSRKTASNDRLRKSKIDIMWGMFYRENVDYPELIWEDFAFQIDHRKERKSRLSRLKFVRIREDYQEYRLPIPNMMPNDTIKQSESYQMFLKYSTGQIPPKKSRGKGSYGKKTVDVSLETVDVSEESEPEPTKKKTGSRSTRGVVIQDPPKAADTMQALQESKKTSRRQPGTGSSSEGTGRIPGVPNESTVVSATSHEGISTKPGVPDEEKNKDKDGDADDEGDDHISDIQDTDDEDAETESDEDEIYKYKIRVRTDEDEEMLNAEVEDSGKGDAEISDVAKANAEKIEEIKDDAKKAKLPLTSSNLSVSLVKDTTDAEINSLLDIKIQSEVPYIQSPSVLTVPILVIFEPVVPTPIPVTPSVAPVTTLLTPSSVSIIPHVPHQTTAPIPTPPITIDAPTITTAVPESDALSAVQLRVVKLEKDVSELKKIDHSAKALATLKSQVLTNLRRVLQRFTRSRGNKLRSKICLKALIEDENAMDKGVSDTVKNHKRQHDDGDDDDDEDPSAGPNQGKKIKRRRTKESKSSKKPSTTKETPKGKAPSKGSKSGKSASTKEPVEEPIVEVVMDDVFNIAGEDVKILGVKSFGVKKLHGYGHLEEVAVKRADRQLYKFKEGDFVDLHLNDIEDMLILAVQHKQFHLNDNGIVDFIVALHMFTRSLIIKRRVEDLQLGVESYQKKLNITAPQ
ncbi:hypothetical protein Tco_1492472 [Tanacetum coccineum]